MLTFVPQTLYDIPLRVQWLNDSNVTANVFGPDGYWTTEETEIELCSNRTSYIINSDGVQIGFIDYYTYSDGTMGTIVIIGNEDYLVNGLRSYSSDIWDWMISNARTLGLAYLVAEIDLRNQTSIDICTSFGYVMDDPDEGEGFCRMRLTL